MPIYEYKCEKCGIEHEVMQKMTEKSLTVCKSCGGRLKKMISSTSFVLKGSGWYVTDYADKTKKNAKEEAPEKKAKVDSSVQKEYKKEKTESRTAKETKKETKSEPKASEKSKE
jgi:putative FmdB family regulatory protein